EPPRRTKDPAGRRPVRLGLGVVAAPRCRYVSAGVAERSDGPHRTGRDRRPTRGAVGTSAVWGDERGGLVAVAVREPFTRPRARHGTSHDHARVFPYLTPICGRQSPPPPPWQRGSCGKLMIMAGLSDGHGSPGGPVCASPEGEGPKHLT